MPNYTIEAIAYDKDGRRLNGNTHTIEADNKSDAVNIAKDRQKSQSGTVRVETKVLRVS